LDRKSARRHTTEWQTTNPPNCQATRLLNYQTAKAPSQRLKLMMLSYPITFHTLSLHISFIQDEWFLLLANQFRLMCIGMRVADENDGPEELSPTFDRQHSSHKSKVIRQL
jgi:hypothetical protein